MKTFALATLALMIAAAPQQAGAVPAVGPDAAACATGGPAVHAHITGLKDRTGRLKLELYPADEADFLKDDRDLVKEGKVFRRVWMDMPASGPVALCIKVPQPGRYALFFTHDRDGQNKFDICKDGAGVPANTNLGRARPKLAQTVVQVGDGVTKTTIKAQYLRGFSGFGPLK